MTIPWFIYAVGSLFMYGIWGALGSKSAQLMDPRAVMLFASLGILITGFACFCALHFKVHANVPGVTYALLTGLVNGLGTICFIAAMRSGPMIPIVTMTALYPMVSILIGVIFMHQTLGLRQVIGIILSIMAILCLVY